MKVVFMEEVEGTARVGEIKNVADGFARNYLLPRKLAAPATEHYSGVAQARAEKEARRQARPQWAGAIHGERRAPGRPPRVRGGRGGSGDGSRAAGRGLGRGRGRGT